MDYVCSFCGENFHDEWLLVAHKELFHDNSQCGRSDVTQYAAVSLPRNQQQQEHRSTQQQCTYYQPTTSSTYECIIPQYGRPSVIQYAPPSTPRNQQCTYYVPSTSSSYECKVSAEALEGKVVRHYTIKNTHNYNLNNFFNATQEEIERVLKRELDRLHLIKFGFVLDTMFINVQEVTSLRSFVTKNRQIVMDSNIKDHIQECFQEIVSKIIEHEGLGSGWSLLHVIGLDVRVHKHGYGNRGSSFIPLPKKIQNTKSCINVKNLNNECFKYAMVCKFVQNEHNPQRASCAKYNQYKNKYDFSGLQYPVSVKDVVNFEKRNVQVSVNVFGLDNSNNVYPLKIVKEEKNDHTDLLLIKKGDKSHYVFIKDFNKLVRSQVTKYHCGAITVCKRCFAYINKMALKGGNKWLAEHLVFCGKQTPVRTILPKPSNAILKFKQIAHQYRVPIVVYADMEASLIPINVLDGEQTSRIKYQNHQPNSYCLLMKSYLSEDHLNNFGLSSKPVVYRGDNVAKVFLNHLYDIAQKVEFLYSYKVSIFQLTDRENDYHNLANTCYICESHFTNDNIKVRDHDHLTGKYRGPACNSCNLNFKLPQFVPIIFHNLSNYDAHFIIPELGRDQGKIDVLATTTEKFISFSKKVNKIKLRFLDSFRFLPSSLMTLSANLSTDELIETKKIVDNGKLDLVLRKGVFPYDYIDSAARFLETQLPAREAFYSKLTESEVAEEDYNHARKVWSELEIKSLGDYSDFYVKLDVTLLTDIMEEFRNTCLSSYGLDPLHSYTSPGFAWQAMLKETKCKLHLLTDIDMILMVESGIRGGLTQSVTRYVKANNKYLPDYNVEKESIYLGYFDSNNQYGWAMTKPLPYGNFKWVNPEDIRDILQAPQHGDKGYILDCDFIYPLDLHDHHYDLPLLPHTMKPPEGKFNKLMMTLENKTRYIAHFWTVQQALQLGLKISKVHRALEFSQSCWLEPYITANTIRRTNATTAFKKDFFKLINNSIFGKCLENQRKHKNVQLVTDPKMLIKLVQKPNFQTSIVINKNLVAVSMEKTVIKMNRPLYVGMSILDISKTLMYDFHYNKMVSYYGRPNIGICYMDTDALLYYIKTSDMYADLKCFPYKNDFDLSDYPVNHPSYDNGVNKKVLGKFKDECCGTPIAEVVALMPKMYAIKLASSDNGNDVIVKKAKGIKSTYIKKHIMFEDYKKCLFENKTYSATYNTIRSFNHKLFSITEKKTCLTSNDDKRKVLDDGIHTLPYGHYILED